MLLVKLPIPVLSLVVLSPVVGVPPVFQQTPLAVTAAPPSEEMSPPLLAVVVAIAETAVVLEV